VQVGNEVVHMVAGRDPDHVLLEVALEQAGLPATALDALAQHTIPAARAVSAEPGALARRVTETERLSQTDELTGADNRRHWLHATRAALAEPGGDRGAVLLCDIDELADINRDHGDRTGDMVLTEVARILARHGRPGRLAGDLFAVWVREGGAAAADAAQRISEELRNAFGGTPGAPVVTVTIGVADAASHGPDLAGVLEAADAAMRLAKDAGTATFEPFSSPVPAVPAVPAV